MENAAAPDTGFLGLSWGLGDVRGDGMTLVLLINAPRPECRYFLPSQTRGEQARHRIRNTVQLPFYLS